MKNASAVASAVRPPPSSSGPRTACFTGPGRLGETWGDELHPIPRVRPSADCSDDGRCEEAHYFARSDAGSRLQIWGDCSEIIPGRGFIHLLGKRTTQAFVANCHRTTHGAPNEDIVTSDHQRATTGPNGRAAPIFTSSAPHRLLILEEEIGNPSFEELCQQPEMGHAFSVERPRAGDAPADLGQFDAAIVAFESPTEDTIDRIHRLQGAAPHVPLIVVLPSSEFEGLAIRAIRSGAQDVIYRDRLNSASFGQTVNHAIERLRRTARLELDVRHDPLTGLPTRTLFVQRVGEVIKLAQVDSERRFAVLQLNLDRFTLINNSLGPESADQLLVAFARRVRRCLRPGDMLARLGTGEFAILLQRLESTRHARTTCESIQRETQAPFHIGGRQVFTTVSVGVAESDHDRMEPEDLLRDAGTALYAAKNGGNGNAASYEPSMHEAAVARFQLEMDLRRGIEKNEFTLHYQPIVDLETGSLQGFEALMRWNHGARGLVPPDRFIPAAEETGLIIPLERRVIRQGCTAIRGWRNLLPPTHPLCLHVNISGKHIIRPDLLTELEAVFRELDIDPQWLRIEITESAIVDKSDATLEQLERLRELGCLLSVDDFGTGYSSLSCLQRYPIDILKIDRSFIWRMNEDSTSTEIVRTILALSEALGLEAIAEGIETAEQREGLRQLGCMSGQGFYFSRPVDEETARQIVLQSAHGVSLNPPQKGSAAA